MSQRHTDTGYAGNRDDGMVNAERGIAWILAAVALVLGAIGLLRGFGIIGPEGVELPIEQDVGGLQAAAIQGNFWDGVVWMLPALALGVHAWAMSGRRVYDRGEERQSMRMLAYLMMALTVGAGVLALLVGFDMLGMGTTQTDGILWGIASLLYSLVAAAAFAAIPSAVADEDYLVRIVEARSARGATSPAMDPGIERPQ